MFDELDLHVAELMQEADDLSGMRIARAGFHQFGEHVATCCGQHIAGTTEHLELGAIDIELEPCG